MTLLPRLVVVAAVVAVGCGGDDIDASGGGDDGDGQACTAMACSDGLDIAFSARQPGSYSFNVIADGEVTTCGATLPLPPCDVPAGGCSRPSVTLGLSGCALPEAEHSLDGISLSGMHPTSVEVFVNLDGEQVAHQSFTPAYQMVAPNGEECGPVCNQASVTLSM